METTLTVGAVLADATTVVADFGPYMAAGLALVFGPRLVTWVRSLIKG